MGNGYGDDVVPADWLPFCQENYFSMHENCSQYFLLLHQMKPKGLLTETSAQWELKHLYSCTFQLQIDVLIHSIGGMVSILTREIGLTAIYLFFFCGSQ